MKQIPISAKKFTLGKGERLKSRKLIERVFREGKSFALFPYRVFYLPGAPAIQPAPADRSAAASGSPAIPPARTRLSVPRPAAPLLQAGFGAGNRNFKKATDRNRIKRLTREAYRLQKYSLEEHLGKKQQPLAVFFIYVGKELPDYQMVTAKIALALQKLLKETDHAR